jgi:phosphoserine phosphatase
VQTLDVDSVIARFASPTRTSGVFAFDGDGTLWSGDIGEDYLETLLEEGWVGPASRAGLEALARHHVAEHREASPPPPLATASAHDLATYLFAEYLAKRFSEQTTCELIAWLPAGYTRAKVMENARHVVERRGIAERLQAETLRVVRWAESAGHRVFIVSASPYEVVVGAAEVLGLPASRVCAVRAQYEDEVMLPRVTSPVPYNEGKVTALRAARGEAPLYAAFGDNAFDLPMLLDAELGVAVRPKDRLKIRAAEAGVAHRLVELLAE